MKRTASLVLMLLVPAALAAQQDTTHRTTSHLHHAKRASHYQTSGGSVALRGSAGLSSDEIRQLQDALQSDGCNPGTVDGVMGPHTRQAMACARHKLGVDSSDPNDLFQALNLNFSSSSTHGMGGVERSGRSSRSMGGMHDSTMMHPDTGTMSGSRMSHHMEAMPGRRHGDTTRTHRMHGDSTGTPSTDRPHASIPRTPRPDSTRRPPR